METMCDVWDSYWWNTSGVYRIREVTYLPFVLFFQKELHRQAAIKLDSELYFSNEIQLKFLE